jgi:fermentation-respiration switch protein FrsA (DUF1100 family)
MRIARFIAAGVIALYLGALAVLYFAQTRLVYLADATQGDPVSAGFPEATVMRLPTEDGESIVAWHLAPERGKKLALYFHGNGGSLRQRGYALRELTSDGMGVLAIDYRGFGGSSGTPSEAGLHLDADAAYAKARELGFTPEEILLVGESLGTGVAVALASRREVSGVVLDSPYSSTVDVAADRYWMFPVSALMRDTFRSDAVIDKVRAPVLIMHGDKDRTVPFRFGEKLHTLAREPKDFLRVADSGHLVMTKPEGRAKLREWLGRLDLMAGR